MTGREVKLGNTRVTGKEQYYTPVEQALEISRRVLKNIPDFESRPFLEPAGGTGAFVKAAQNLGFRDILAFDIEPLHDLVKYGDFLDVDVTLHDAICITNPPFGRNNSLSIPFFNKAAEHSELMAFIVPTSWRKWSVLNRLDGRFRLIDDWDLGIDYVDAQGLESHGVGSLSTCVQVWQRHDGPPRLKVVIPDFGVIEKTTFDKADVSLTLFGYGCGTVKTDFSRKPNTTQGFFRLKHPRALEALTSVDFSLFYRHTAYTPALGLQEINFLLNNYLGLDDRPYSLDPLSQYYLGLQ